MAAPPIQDCLQQAYERLSRGFVALDVVTGRVNRGVWRLYAALRGDDSVALIDLDTLEITAQISMGPGSGHVCMYWLGAP